MKSFLIRWLATSVGVLVAGVLVGDIHLGGALGTVIGPPLAGLALALFNTALRPSLLAIALPLMVRTLGFFYLVVNVLLLKLVCWAVGLIVPGFGISGIAGAFWGSIWIGLVSFGLNLWLNPGQSMVRVFTSRQESMEGENPQIKPVKGRVIEQ